jgi:Uma2 family endonuclease
MATQTRVRFLASDIWDAPEDRNIYEVIDGELYVTPAPGWWHQNAVSVLLALISSYIRPPSSARSSRRRPAWCSTTTMAWSRT